MSVNPKRLRALPLAVMVAAAVPLVAPVAANAAMGGANALTTSLRPDLRSATVQSTNAVDDTTTVRACFSKPIASLPQAALFAIGDYKDDDAGDDLHATSAVRSSANCADAVFPNDDATQFTYLTALGSDGTAPDSGISAVSTNGFGNIQDSTALIGSNTHNGTRGFSSAPDLVGIQVNNALSAIDYTFDQRVASVPGVLATDFVANNPDGTEVQSLDHLTAPRQISADRLTVRVFFAAGDVTNVVRAFVADGAVDAKDDPGGGGQSENGLRSAARPGTDGNTDAPDLVSVVGSADGSTVDFTYDRTLTGAVAPADFMVGRSSSQFITPVAVAIVGGPGNSNTVRATIGGADQFSNEFWVEGASLEGAVTGVVGGDSTAGGLPMGGNVGAFATGFTVGPEALRVTFDNATNTVQVLFDQRWGNDNEPDFKLIDDQGSQIAAGAINVAGGGALLPGQTTATVTFPAGTVAGARALLLQQGAVETIGGLFFESRVQAISPTAPAARKGMKFRVARTR